MTVVLSLGSSAHVLWCGLSCCTALFGKDKAAKKMLQQLPEVFRQVWYWCGCHYTPLYTFTKGSTQHIWAISDVQPRRPCIPDIGCVLQCAILPARCIALTTNRLCGPALLSPQVQREHHLPPGDFPDVHRFRDILSAFDLSNFPKLSKSMVKQIDDVLCVDIPNLVRAFDNPYS